VKKTVVNLAASLRQRLLNLATERKEDFGLVLSRYGLELRATGGLHFGLSDVVVKARFFRDSPEQIPSRASTAGKLTPAASTFTRTSPS
jgi:hypothetical protein